jgi:hypothetical protein
MYQTNTGLKYKLITNLLLLVARQSSRCAPGLVHRAIHLATLLGALLSVGDHCNDRRDGLDVYHCHIIVAALLARPVGAVRLLQPVRVWF